MEITINTPALLFPAISLIVLAFTNRFLALSSRIRQLHDKYIENNKSVIILGQIKNMRYRLKLIKNMQALGILSIIGCILCMFAIYFDFISLANWVFAFSLIAFTLSLCVSFLEIQLSTKALELELSDMEGLENPTVLEYFKRKFDNRDSSTK